MWGALGLLIGFLCFGLIEVIIRWLNPPLKPPEDEWEKWSKL